MPTPLVLVWKIKFVLKMRVNAWGIKGFFFIKQIKKPRLCSVLV